MCAAEPIDNDDDDDNSDQYEPKKGNDKIQFIEKNESNQQTHTHGHPRRFYFHHHWAITLQINLLRLSHSIHSSCERKKKENNNLA